MPPCHESLLSQGGAGGRVAKGSCSVFLATWLWRKPQGPLHLHCSSLGKEGPFTSTQQQEISACALGMGGWEGYQEGLRGSLGEPRRRGRDPLKTWGGANPPLQAHFMFWAPTLQYPPGPAISTLSKEERECL